jgi:hypothetical protein
MDYYASWPVWKMPKWLGLMLGGIFTVIVIGCAWMIVDLTHPPAPHPVAARKAVAPATPTPTVATPTVAAATVAATPATAVKKSPPHKRTILAKHDPKSTRPKKDELDRLLGL